MTLGEGDGNTADPVAGTPLASKWRSWGLPIVAGLCGALMVAESTTLTLFEQYTGLGAGFMVALVGTALLVIAAALAVQLLAGVVFEPEGGEGVDPTAAVSWPEFLLAATGVALPVVAIPWLGFPTGAGIAYACVTRAFGSRNLVLDLLIGLVVASVAWAVFTKLGVQLGPFLPSR